MNYAFGQDFGTIYNQSSLIVNFISVDQAKGYEQRKNELLY